LKRQQRSRAAVEGFSQRMRNGEQALRPAESDFHNRSLTI
jgi:hypothetical protein